jgi:pimeloyl-ACP methyl ester carboxylesterase
MGAIAVLAYAANTTGIAGVIAVSSPPDWRIPLRSRALVATALARTRPGRWVAARHMSVHVNPVWTPPETARSLEPQINVPLAIIHGERDRLIPYTSALPPSSHSRRQTTIVPGMGHAFDEAGHGAINDAVDWILDA